ncbi:MAG: DNA primase, partial [Lachnospiraceae bacterium]|nr:DNA primase [Lachnospiraceae bacterium]
LKEQVNQIGYRMVTGEEAVSPAVRRTNRPPEQETQKQMPQKLLLTYLVNQPELIGRLEGIIGRSDFYEPVYSEVAEAVYAQYAEKKTVMPATILNQFTDLEIQKQAADICQTTLKTAVEKENEQQMLTELVKKVKLDSIEHELEASTDMAHWQSLSREKNAVMRWTMPEA